MAYKRALWHSGLIYRRECDQCKMVIEYTDDKLDFRPWYPDGFVYCPRCQTPLRHSERLAITAPPPAMTSMVSPTVTVPMTTVAPSAQTPQTTPPPAKFCHQCGAQIPGDALFCIYCGVKQ